MPHQHLQVKDLPFNPVPEYSRTWITPPDDWFATVSPASQQYPGDFVGDQVTFTASDPDGISRRSWIETRGLIVIRETNNTDCENTFEYIEGQSVFSGTIHGKFEYFPGWFSRELSEGSLYPDWQEAKKAANAFVHGIHTEREDV